MTKSASAGPLVHALIRERWSPRAFADRDVPRDVLRSLFEAAQWAASSYNEQPWRFVVARRDDPEAFERLLSCLVPFNRDWARSAPVLVATVARQRFAHNGKENRHAFHDVGLAVAQLTLQAASQELHVHQMAGIDVAKTRQALGIPEGYDPVTVLAVGYPGEERGESSRKGLGEIVFGGRWGEKASFGG